MYQRSAFHLLALIAAALTAILIGRAAHEGFGLSRGEIRYEALGIAALIGVTLLARLFVRRSE